MMTGTASRLDAAMTSAQFTPRLIDAARKVRSHSGSVWALSDGSATTTQDVTVKVAHVPDQNHGPTAPALTLTHAPNEYEASGTLVGTLAAADQDGDALSYALLDSAGGRFKLVNGNQLVVDNGFLFDFEQATSHKVGRFIAGEWHFLSGPNL